MSDLTAVAWWCLAQIIGAVPFVAAYYFGRWTQSRRHDPCCRRFEG